MRREGTEEEGERGRETVGKRRKDMINEIGQKKKKKKLLEVSGYLIILIQLYVC